MGPCERDTAQPLGLLQQVPRLILAEPLLCALATSGVTIGGERERRKPEHEREESGRDP